MTDPVRLVARAKQCFAISPIGDDGSATRRRSNLVFERIIVPAATECGYEESNVIRGDLIQKPGTITSQIIQQIADADLVIADLTDHNPNVFYELAIRHASARPAVILVERNQNIPFDIAQDRAIRYDLTDWDSPERCKKVLVEQIRFCQQNPDSIDNPVSRAIEFRALAQSKDPNAKAMAQVLSDVQDIQSAVHVLQRLVTTSAMAQVIASSKPGETLWGTGRNDLSPSLDGSNRPVLERFFEAWTQADRLIQKGDKDDNPPNQE